MSLAVQHFPEPDEGRQPPANLEAEQSLLGALLVNNLAYGRVSEFLRAEHFASVAHAKIYEAAAGLIESGRLANAMTLKNAFESDRDMADVGGASYLARLAASATTIANSADYGRLVFELWKRRYAIQLADALRAQMFDFDPEISAKEILEVHDQQLTKLISEGTTGEGPRPLGTFLQQAIERVEAAWNGGEAITGVTTGLKELDNLLGGLHPSDLILLAARPSMGKTTLAVGMGIAAAKAGTGVGIFSLEMAGAQVAINILASDANVSSQDQKRGRIDQDKFNRLDRSVRAMKSLPVWLDDTPSLTIPALRARARSLKRRGVGLILVDYLQLLRMGDRQPSRYEEVTEISRALKAIAKELNVPVVALSQLSRQVEQRADKRPNLSDLRESGALEQDADVVAFLYRDEYYLEREKPPTYAKADVKAAWDEAMLNARGKAEIIIGKQRTGPIGTVQVSYEATASRFADLIEDDAPIQESLV